ncbi:putative atp binding [Phaeomoniella chlamydospora]|uniref:Putative atp binding n=1 Tax=Phaeomoniella chlamydospora TaxID=158046 RepID=A0A0G2DWF1_PHACM|nr:putative atp binding [Phaeomoniella chlamydospora]
MDRYLDAFHLIFIYKQVANHRVCGRTTSGIMRRGGGKRGRPGRGRDLQNYGSGFDRAMNAASEPSNAPFARTRMTTMNASEARDTSIALPNLKIRQYLRATDQTGITFNSGQCLSEIPTSEEIMSQVASDAFKITNNVSGPWASRQSYLETHYTLLREDSQRSLREAVQMFVKSPAMSDDQNVAIYEKVHVIGFTFTQQGLAARLRFSTARSPKKIFWEHSKRLISGTMVALSPAKDNFKTKCIIAIIAARPIDGITLIPPELDIYFARPEQIELDPQIEFVMVEARSGYYEATRHVMKAIKKLHLEKFPLSSHIVQLDPSIKSPKYLEQSPCIDLAAVTDKTSIADNQTKFDIIKDWPQESLPGTDLDNSQWSALHRILTKQLAIIQGPPGTGKTYVSVAALKILLANKCPEDPPIIVAAHTNHALDQLLRHVAKFEPDYIRLGGRSTDDEIKRRALYEVRRSLKIPPVKGGCFVSSIHQHKATTAELLETLAPITCSRDDATPILGSELFHSLGLLTNEQLESLSVGTAQWTGGDSTNEDPLSMWLGKSVIPFQVSYRDGTYGFQEETESQGDQEYEQLKELEAEQGVEEEDRDILNGTYKAIGDALTVPRSAYTAAGTAERYLERSTDLWTIPSAARGPVYSFLQKTAKEIIREEFRSRARSYQRVCQEVQIGKWERDAAILQTCKVVGLTMTGLSKYRPLISSLEPKIILIEEAAEALEAPVAVACVESLQQLILVGDHQQLQPSTSVQQLGRPPFNLQISLFERLVRNGIPYDTLLRQRRMDPEFRLLLTPIYKKLEDHPSVVNRPFVPGCKFKLWMFSHDFLESADSSFSKMNEREALMIVAFFNYLVLNGVPIHGITVLVFYNAQRKLILRELRKSSRLAGHYLNVVTVDSYQGEENAVVLLSLPEDFGKMDGGKKTPSPKKSQQSKLDSPGGWTKYADGGVVQDDRRLADNLRQQQLQTLPRLPEVLDNDNLELNYARQWQNGTTTNPVRYVEPPVLAEGIISETTQRISDGNGGYRTIYKHHYGPIRPNLLVAGHNLDGGASTEEEPLIEL